MAILPILVAPHPVLKTKAKPVENISPEIQTLLDDMLDTMYNAKGVGLAAPQIGVSLRVVVVDVSDDRDQPMKMINPEIIWESEDERGYDEGCLSFPDQYSEVVRPDLIKVQYLNELGETCEVEAGDLLSTCIQHEIDHLDGVNFVDHLSSLKRNMIMRKLKKVMKSTEVAYDTV